MTAPGLTPEQFWAFVKKDEAGELTCVQAIPVIRVVDWKVFRIDGCDHVLGWHWTLIPDGIVSGRTVAFSINGRFARAESGRIYVLEGDPLVGDNWHPHAYRAFNNWKHCHQPKQVMDVTEDYKATQRRLGGSDIWTPGVL